MVENNTQGVLLSNRNKPKLTNYNDNSNYYNFNNSVSLSTSNIFESAFDRQKRKQQELIIEGKNNQAIKYGSNIEDTNEHKDINRLYQSIDKIGGLKKNSNNLEDKNKLNKEFGFDNYYSNSNLRNIKIQNIMVNNSNNNSGYSGYKAYNTHNENSFSNQQKAKDIINNTNQLLQNYTSYKEIPKETKKYKLNYFKFMSLHEQNKLRILQFMEPQDYYSFAITCKNFYNILINYLLKIAKDISDNFNSIYKRLLHSSKPTMVVQKCRDYRGKRFYISLIIKAEVFSLKLIRKTVSIGYLSKFFNDKIGYSNVFKFDVYENSVPLNFWLMREYTYVRLFFY